MCCFFRISPNLQVLAPKIEEQIKISVLNNNVSIVFFVNLVSLITLLCSGGSNKCL